MRFCFQAQIVKSKSELFIGSYYITHLLVLMLIKEVKFCLCVTVVWLMAGVGSRLTTPKVSKMSLVMNDINHSMNLCTIAFNVYSIQSTCSVYKPVVFLYTSRYFHHHKLFTTLAHFVTAVDWLPLTFEYFINKL